MRTADEMTRKIRILLLDDTDEDAELILRALRKAGLLFEAEHVRNRGDFVEKLTSFAPDVIISDYNMPGFDGMAALEVVKDHDQRIPVLIVTGALGDEHAVELLKAGAKDYVLKDRLARLSPAVTRVLADAAEARRRREAELARQKAEARFKAMIESISDIILLCGLDGNMSYVSPSVKAVGGYEPEELLGRSLFELLHPDDTQAAMDALQKIGLSPGVLIRTELRFVNKAGDWITLESMTRNLVHVAGVGGLVITARDITERKAQEQTTQRIARMHEVLSGINGLIVRARSREELFSGACKLLVETGRMRLVWIGIMENDQSVKAIAFHGAEDGYLDQIAISLDPTDARGRGPTGTALREKKSFFCNDIANDPMMQPWREGATERGFRSSGAVPFIVNGTVTGCLNAYSGETGYFDTVEQNLLNEIGRNISYALEFILHREEADYLAYFDPLTGLARRNLFLERVEEHLKIARKDRRMAAVMMIDIDNFKAVNDANGRAVGDELLKGMSKRLISIAGAQNFLARVTADRFAAVIPNLVDAANLTNLVNETLIARLTRPFTLQGKEVRVTGRAGLALFPADGEDAGTLLGNAESALKSAKREGERVVFYTKQMGEAVSARLKLENSLRSALENEEFVLHYQPKVELHTGTICGAEALIRWNSPELGLVPPVRFIPLLEETGLIIEVGGWALRQAVRDRLKWNEAGLHTPRIAVNVSPVQMKQASFVELVSKEVISADDRAPGIDLEVTESMLMGDLDAGIEKLTKLRDLGIGIAIDDFGTGYSSLAYLSRLPINAVKIDRSFIITMADNADTMSIVSTIITLAHSMNLKVVAEGVDSAEQLKFLRLLRCDEIQGYLFSKPLPADEFAALLKSGKRLT
jgi:diguanylate cyclase (GGDEF)-like protein/PAS domain S-box-containing protein